MVFIFFRYLYNIIVRLLKSFYVLFSSLLICLFVCLFHFKIVPIFFLILKFFFLLSFFFFNFLSFFIFLDTTVVLYIFLQILSSLTVSLSVFSFFEFCFVFVYDLFSYLWLFFCQMLNLKIFSGFFYYLVQTIEFVFYEMIRQFAEQGEEHDIEYFRNWMPRYLFGDSLSRSIRFNKIINIFDFSGVIREKIFVYRRVGIVHSRFWLFRIYPNTNELDDFVKFQVGKLTEPDRWLLNFRDFNLFDYIDPWFYFQNGSIFRTTIPLKDKDIEIELLHNYHSIMETPQFFFIERVYSDDFVSSVFLFELVILYVISGWAMLVFDHQRQYFDLTEEQLYEVPEEISDYNFRHYEAWEMSENFEARMSSIYPYDFLDYFTDDDLSWDSLLAQPYSLRDSFPQSLDVFEIVKHHNFLLDEFRSFSFLLPLYRLLNKLSVYKPIDYFLFENSSKVFKLSFYFLLYLPIGFIIVVFKYIICFFDWINSFHFLIKFIFIFLLFCFFLLFFAYF